MEAVVKVGGSLAENPDALKALGAELCRITRNHQITVVPGGGKFADVVRELDKRFGLSPVFSHRMAILAMDQFGLFLSQVIPEACLCDSIEEARLLVEQGKVALFMPSKLLFESDPFEPSWDVTSDSIATHIAAKLQTQKVIFVTDVDGVFDEDPKLLARAKLQKVVSADELLRRGGRTSVDKFLPNLLLETKLDAYVVNGAYPQRVSDILSGQQTICTHIITG
jgi:5-(aminomethyl)-3-furanmethanol phosphate kinase